MFFAHCQFGNTQQDGVVYNKPYCNATLGNTLSYISRVGNVRGSKGLRPRNKVIPSETNWEKIRRRFGFVSETVMKNTWGITTQLANMDVRFPMRRHYKSRSPHANVTRLHETFSTDTMFGSTMALGGYTSAQVFVGNTSRFTAVYGLKREAEGLEAFESFITDWGAPDKLRQDNSKIQNSDAWKELERKYHIKSELSEPHNQQQNPAERRIQTLKHGTEDLMNKTGCPRYMWFHAMIFLSAILNMLYLDRLGGRNAHEVTFGHSVDISPWIQHEFRK